MLKRGHDRSSHDVAEQTARRNADRKCAFWLITCPGEDIVRAQTQIAGGFT